jgi:hypothetical protein
MFIPQPVSVKNLRFNSLLLFSVLFLLFSVATTSAQTVATDKPARVYSDKAPSDPFQAALIPRNSKVYIAPMVSEDPSKPLAVGFESYLASALRKKTVPLIIVADISQADFIIEGTADKKAAGLAKKILLGDFRKSTSASMTVTNLRTGVVAYADSSDKSSANRGMRSSAEKLAKYLKQKMERDEKKMGKG